MTSDLEKPPKSTAKQFRRQARFWRRWEQPIAPQNPPTILLSRVIFCWRLQVWRVKNCSSRVGGSFLQEQAFAHEPESPVHPRADPPAMILLLQTGPKTGLTGTAKPEGIALETIVARKVPTVVPTHEPHPCVSSPRGHSFETDRRMD